MGRRTTGACTTGEVKRIELSYLLRKGFLIGNKEISGILSWTDGSSIAIASSFTEGSRYLRLSYSTENRYTGERVNQDYRIQLITIPSNLGRSEIVYFICPITGRRARILYKCYGSLIWKSRNAYRHRIYYESQQCSKLDYHNRRYWALEKELEKCRKKSKKKVYQDKPTRLRKRIQILNNRKNYHDYLRWVIIPKSLQKGMNQDLINELRGWA